MIEADLHKFGDICDAPLSIFLPWPSRELCRLDSERIPVDFCLISSSEWPNK